MTPLLWIQTINVKLLEITDLTFWWFRENFVEFHSRPNLGNESNVSPYV